MAVPAPRCNLSRASDAMHVITDVGASISADLNLTTIAGKPKWGPQRTTLWNDTAAAVNVVLVDENSITHTISVPVAGSCPLVLTRPFKTLVDTGSGDVNVCFEWFDKGGSLDWNKLASEV